MTSEVSNYPVGLFLTLDLPLAAVRMIASKKVGYCFLALEKAKKVVPKLTLRHIYIYIYLLIY